MGRLIQELLCFLSLPYFAPFAPAQNIGLATGNSAEDTDKETGEVVTGVTSERLLELQRIQDLAEVLVEPSPGRSHGELQAQPFLIRAGPGTGKTWSMQQLIYCVSASQYEPCHRNPSLLVNI